MTTVAYMRCQCGDSVSIKKHKLHIRYDCPRTPEASREAAKAARDARAKRAKRNRKKERQRLKDRASAKWLKTFVCENPECLKPFAPRSVMQRACSRDCGNKIHGKIYRGDMPSKDIEVEQMRPFSRNLEDVARKAEEAAARIKTGQESHRLWALCLDVPALAA